MVRSLSHRCPAARPLDVGPRSAVSMSENAVLYEVFMLSFRPRDIDAVARRKEANDALPTS